MIQIGGKKENVQTNPSQWLYFEYYSTETECFSDQQTCSQMYEQYVSVIHISLT